MTKRFQRVSRAQVRLTQRDFGIVEAVFCARYMTNQLVAQLLFTPTTFSACKERLRRLFDLRYLNKRKAYVNEPDIYYLGLRGKRYIVALGEYSKEQVDRIAGVSGGRAAAPFLMMRHELTIAKLYVNARQECEKRGWSLRWRNTRMLELQKLAVQPDAWLEVSHGESCRLAYLEFTAVMPDQKELLAKVRAYQALWDKTGDPTPLLWLTTSRNKANHLREAAEQCDYRDYFLVGLLEDAGEFLTKPIWRWSEAPGEMVQWIKPSR